MDSKFDYTLLESLLAHHGDSQVIIWWDQEAIPLQAPLCLWRQCRDLVAGA